MNRRRILLAGVAASALLAACGSDAAPTATTAAARTTLAVTSTGVPTSSATATTSAPVSTTTVVASTTAAPTTATPTTAAPTATAAPTTTTIPPDALQQVPGMGSVAVTASGDDPGRPVFQWTAVDGATSYQLVVQSADGTPLWGWSGTATTVPLGGVDHPADVEGPTLVSPGRARVYAFDGSMRLIAVSAWLALTGGTPT